jgi:hypothetical protein
MAWYRVQSLEMTTVLDVGSNTARTEAVVIDPKNEPLVLDLVEWVAREPREYAEVMEAWRTSCPKLAIWEDASDRGLVARERVADRLVVVATAQGRRLLETNGRRSAG